MDEDSKEKTGGVPTASEGPRSLKIAEDGIKNSHQFASFMSALMSDIISGRVTPMMANATCNASAKLLKIVEMQHRYGTDGHKEGGIEKILKLVQ